MVQKQNKLPKQVGTEEIIEVVDDNSWVNELKDSIKGRSVEDAMMSKIRHAPLFCSFLKWIFLAYEQYKNEELKIAPFEVEKNKIEGKTDFSAKNIFISSSQAQDYFRFMEKMSFVEADRHSKGYVAYIALRDAEKNLLFRKWVRKAHEMEKQ